MLEGSRATLLELPGIRLDPEFDEADDGGELEDLAAGLELVGADRLHHRGEPVLRVGHYRLGQQERETSLGVPAESVERFGSTHDQGGRLALDLALHSR